MIGDHRLTNGVVELIVSTAHGLRISRYGFVGSTNLLAPARDRSIDTALGRWQPLGGHRLWVAPESMPSSYAPDALPIACHVRDDRTAGFVAPVDEAGIEKRLDLSISPQGTDVNVTHLVVNRGFWPIRVAPWAISIVADRASAYIPQPSFKSHAEAFLPARATVHWWYTDLTDPRWIIGRRLLVLTPDAARSTAQKIGAGNTAGWCAVHLDEQVFLKQFEWRAAESYPDLGCNNELFTIADYLEVETLGPLQLLEPGEAAAHTERWSLFDVGPASVHEEEQRALLESLLRR
jgi:hypothetical protein